MNTLSVLHCRHPQMLAHIHTRAYDIHSIVTACVQFLLRRLRQQYHPERLRVQVRGADRGFEMINGG